MQYFVRQDIQTIVEMCFRITQELNIFDDQSIDIFCWCCIFHSCGIETNGFVMSNSVSECLYRLKFVVYSPLA